MGKVTISKTFTGTTLFNDEGAAASTSGSINISRYNHLDFYAQLNATGGAGLVASLSAEVSPDGVNFFPYSGFLPHDNVANTGVTGFTLNTSGSTVFSIKHIGGIHTIRMTLTMANVIASTSFDLFFSARTDD